VSAAAPVLGLLIALAVFVGLVAREFRPGARARANEAARIPFREEDRA
jgi:cbb3-type cytochrome oxidase subunit 3